ncbi:heme biosynthesis protein HemY [Kordiimonas aquimaris]|uniref:heme biosynthesis protein HemY n=1 Tax=Kordiimonas aquimaris TaxID=707591 RepID=UPI0021D23E43|nr:tetratricopeptide repeat protein [Kordiimonas aquimaris]
MIRLSIWFVFILVLAALAAWLADHPGLVTIQFQAFAVDTSFAALVLALSGVAALTALMVWFVGWVRRDMPIWGSNNIIKRQRRGFKILNQSLVALSAGDHKLALQLVQQAEVLLPPQPMVHLIAAEAATRDGDHAAAAKRYAALENTDDGRLLGLRGLLTEAKRTGRDSEALRIARVAFTENRKSPWVLKTLFALEVAAGNWAEAETALEKVAREKLLNAETIQRHRGAVAYAEATELKMKGDRPAATKALKRALKYRPGFAPAVVALARLEMSSGNMSKASKIITEAWSKAPHATLAAAYKELDTAEAATDWLKRVRTLIKAQPDHAESLLLLVDGLMDAGEYTAAKPVLERLLKEAPSRAAWQYRLALAHVLKEDPDPIETALKHAPESAAWRCGQCGHKPMGWAPLCEDCDMFDSLVWSNEQMVTGPRKSFDPDGTIAMLTDSSVL